MAMRAQDRALWSVRFGTISGACLGLLLSFGAAWLVERSGHDPEWVLRVGSAAGLLGCGWLGRRIGSSGGERRYNALGALTGLLVAAAVTVLLLSAFGAAK